MNTTSDAFWLSFGLVMGFFLAGCIFWGLDYERLSSAQPNSYSNEADQRPANQPNSGGTPPLFVQVIPAPKTAEERAQEAEDREEKKSADKWLVRWTASLFIATVGLILATGVLGYFSYRQGADMKDSIAAARDSADAAIASMGSERAWLIFDHFDVDELSDCYVGQDFCKRGLMISITWKNRGRSPALKTETFADKKLIQFNEQNPSVFEPIWEGKEGVPIGPDAIFSSPQQFLLDNDREDVFNRSKAVIVYGTVRYRDIFKSNIVRTGEICGRITFTGYRTRDGKVVPNFDMLAFGPQNTAT